MPNTFETSFIPQQPLLKVEGAQPRIVSMNVALVASLVMFFVSLTVAGGMYFFKTQEAQKIADKEQALVGMESTLNIDEINSFKTLQNKLDVVKHLVDQHTIFSSIFNLIEDETAVNIGLTALHYSYDTDGLHVELSGVAPSYEAVYFQVETWRKLAPVVKKVFASGYALDEYNGTVTFKADLTIDVAYAQSASVIADQAKQAEMSSAKTGDASSSQDLGTIPVTP